MFLFTWLCNTCNPQSTDAMYIHWCWWNPHFLFWKMPHAASHIYIFFHSHAFHDFCFLIASDEYWICISLGHVRCVPTRSSINQCNVSHYILPYILLKKASFICPYFFFCPSSFIYTIYSLWKNKLRMEKVYFSNQKK